MSRPQRKTAPLEAQPTPPGGSGAPQGFELWAKLGFGVCALAALMTLYLGLRPGGARPVQIYGLWFVPGLLGALLLAISLVYGATHRPLLQRGRLKAWLALSACLWWSVFPFPYPSSHAGHASLVPFELPFSGEWQVIFAGDRWRENPLVLRPETRFGIAFARADAGEVRAPCPGVVLAIEALPGFEERVSLTLEVRPLERLILRGIERSSLTVGRGDSLVQGAPIGRTDRLDIYLHDPYMEGIPMRFSAFFEGEKPIERGALRVGSSVSPGGRGAPDSQH